MSERPLFIDPISIGGGTEVDDVPAPRWFWLAALTIAVVAAYYVGSFWSGPRDSSHHDFDRGGATTQTTH